MKNKQFYYCLIRLEIVFQEKTRGNEDKPETKQTQAKFNKLFKLVRHGADWAMIMLVFKDILEAMP